MKTFYKILALLFLFNMSNAQTSIYLSGGYESGIYYKDIDNDLDKFVGTWLYTHGNTSFKIILKKRVHTYSQAGNYHNDLLVGEYQYIQDGIEYINTLNNIDNNPTVYEYNNQIFGNDIFRCDECLPGERDFISLILFDPVIHVTSELRVRYLPAVGNDQPKLKIATIPRAKYLMEGEEITPAYHKIVKQQTYIMNKL